MSKNVNLPEENKEDCVRIEGVLFSHSNGDYGLWDGLYLKKEDESSIYSILNAYDTDGCSIRERSKKALFEEELRMYEKSDEEKKALYKLAERIDSFVSQFGDPDYETYSSMETIKKIYDNLLVGKFDVYADYIGKVVVSTIKAQLPAAEEFAVDCVELFTEMLKLQQGEK